MISCFYLFCFLGASFVGYFRGTGRVNLPVLGTTIHMSLRVVLSYRLIGRLRLGAIAIAPALDGLLWPACTPSFSCIFAAGKIFANDPSIPSGLRSVDCFAFGGLLK